MAGENVLSPPLPMLPGVPAGVAVQPKLCVRRWPDQTRPQWALDQFRPLTECTCLAVARALKYNIYGHRQFAVDLAARGTVVVLAATADPVN